MNEPAFPSGEKLSIDSNGRKDDREMIPLHVSMTLRDYFAAKVLQRICAGPGAVMVAERDGRYDETNWAQVVAMNAYEMADAMLAMREGGK